MLNDIKKMLGLSNNDFDSIIEGYIESAKLDLKAVGVDYDRTDCPDALVKSAILSYVMGSLDTHEYRENYMNSYYLQKDALRHYGKYKED